MASDAVCGGRSQGGAPPPKSDRSYPEVAGRVNALPGRPADCSQFVLTDAQLASVRAKLKNQQFIDRAPADVVQREREKEQSWQDQRDQLAAKLRALGC